MSTQAGNKHTRTMMGGVGVRTGQRTRRRPLGRAVRRVGPLVLIAVVLAFAAPLAADRKDVDAGTSFSVFTQNAYVGASIERVIAANPNDPYALIDAVTTTYYEMLASDPDVRMSGIADRIADRKPDVVALQEMYMLRKQSPGDLIIGGTEPATEVVVDFLHSLMDSLAARSLHYAVAAVSTELDVEMPMLNLVTYDIDDARLTDREVILVRTDLPPGQLRVSNRQAGHFDTHLILPDSGLEILQGWCSVDVFVRGERFRFINAHLQDEAFPDIQFAQAQELMAGPANTNLPVMMVGDFNADPNGLNGTWTYPSLIAGGFADTWSELYPHRPGLTWGHDALLADRDVEFRWRIDLVLFKGHRFVPNRAETVDRGLRRQEPPFWPSDHAGVSASFWLR
jgi:endonuclease/exonuclease/phosphatase family metal-dependent hydrolase